jgi:hypothetical protein
MVRRRLLDLAKALAAESEMGGDKPSGGSVKRGRRQDDT